MSIIRHLAKTVLVAIDPFRRGRGRHAFAKSLVAAIALCGAFVALATPAQAYTVTTVSGSYPGTAEVPLAQLVPDSFAAVLLSSPRTIYENPSFGARTQYVCITHRSLLFDPGTYTYVDERGALVTFNGRWLVFNTVAKCGYIGPAATSVWDSGATFTLGDCSVYSLDVMITWRLDGPAGALLGTKLYNYVHESDYRLTPGAWRLKGTWLGRFGFSGC